ncbi:MAG: peptidylprolyl isomerase [Planctomycetes bacterium]|nr:peptidylprolyl isomerase [Planctomycetota bacterium]
MNLLQPLLLSLALGGAPSAIQISAPAGAGTLAAQPELPGALPDTDPVLVIDGQTITWGEYSRWLVRTIGERQAIEFSLDYYTVEREAARRQVDLAPGAAESAVERDLQLRIEKGFHGRIADWLDELRRTDRTETGVRAERALEARRELLGGAIANIDRVVPEHKIVREWELRYGHHGRRYELRMMQFRPETVAPEKFSRDEWRAREAAAKDAAQKRALAARARVVAGEDFETLASQLSEDPDTRLHRGQPAKGYRDPGWPWSFQDELEKLAADELSQPIYAKGGWWLVRPVKIDVTPLADVHHALELELIARGPEPDEVGAVHQRLKEGVSWKVLPAMWSAGGDGERPDMLEPVLSIDGQPVAKGVYARFLCRMQGEAMASSFVESFLVQKRARELGITSTLEEAQERARAYIDDQVKTSEGGTRESWEEYLKNGTRSPELLLHEYTFRSLTDVLAEKLIKAQRKLTPEDLRREYLDQYGTEGERLELRLIALPIAIPAPEDGLSREELDRRVDEATQKIQAHARELLDRVRAGAEFAALARDESKDLHSASAGGLMQERFRPDRWTPEIYAAVRAAREGELVGPLCQNSICFVFQVVARHKASFEEVRAQLEQDLRERRPSTPELGAFRNSLRREAEVEVLPGLSR